MIRTNAVPKLLSVLSLASLLSVTASAQDFLPTVEVKAIDRLQLHESPPERMWPLSFIVWQPKPIEGEIILPGQTFTILNPNKEPNELSWRDPSRWFHVRVSDGTEGWFKDETGESFESVVPVQEP